MFAQDFWEGMTVPDNNDDLAKAVRDWIDSHGLTQAKISARGGPSSTTITKILSGRGSFRAAVFGQIDRGLEWGDGRAEEVWQGEPDGSRIDWREASDDQLLEEVRRRLAERTHDRGNDAKKRLTAADSSTGEARESAAEDETRVATRGRRVRRPDLSRERD